MILRKKFGLLAAKSTFGPVHLIPSAEKLAYSNLMESSYEWAFTF
jgi:hypothetical protein